VSQVLNQSLDLHAVKLFEDLFAILDTRNAGLGMRLHVQPRHETDDPRVVLWRSQCANVVRGGRELAGNLARFLGSPCEAVAVVYAAFPRLRALPLRSGVPRYPFGGSGYGLRGLQSSPFLLAASGPTRARDLLITGEPYSDSRCPRIGIDIIYRHDPLLAVIKRIGAVKVGHVFPVLFQDGSVGREPLPVNLN